jgi:simple sugar transport system permease protein
MEDILSLILGLGLTTLTMMVPVLLATIGEIVTERSGIVNIGLEGILLLGAFFAVIATERTGTPAAGVLAGAGIGALIGVTHGVISTKLKGQQIVNTIGVNIFALGVVGFGIYAVWGVWGAKTIQYDLKIPAIRFGDFGLSPMIFIALGIALFTNWWLFRTPFGMAVRAVGENPDAADVVGINVDLVRIIATTYGSMLAGIGGAYLSIDWFGGVTKEISAGRGFLALANVAFSNWNPLVAIAGSMIFGFFDALVLWIGPLPQVSGVIPQELLRTIPYIATIIVVSGAIKRVRPPKALALPYSRE